MNTQQDEFARIQRVVTESVQRFLSQPTPGGIALNRERMDALLGSLPALTERDLEKLGHKDSSCSICIQPLLAILAEEETASAMESPAYFSGELGVTRLSQPWQCGHIFCRRDITKWIKSGKLTCPMCRKSFVEPGTQSEEQSWEEPDLDIETHPIFAVGDNTDFQRIFSGQAPVHLSPTFGQQHRQDTGNSGGSEYSGMYS